MWNLIHFDEIHSTQTYAKEEKLPVYTIVSARHQTAGVGQYGRVWNDHHQSVMLTAICPLPDIPVALFTQYMALNIIEQLSDCCDDIQIKWPNDLVIGRKKLGGILTEVIDDVVYLGIGINITAPLIPTGCGLKEACAEIDYDTIQARVIQAIQQPIKQDENALLHAHAYYQEGVRINNTHYHNVRITDSGALAVDGQVYIDSKAFEVFYE
ncbi:MAG: biotin--[acetyl-CoA-carboxylase] ligase [Culicoidibacterales bacterium]